MWDSITDKKLDKDRFRKDLGDLIPAYTEVAKRLGILHEQSNVSAVNITKLSSVKKIMTITNASSEMIKSFEHMSNDYHKLEAPKRENNYKKTMFSKQENAKINEIFDEFNDDFDDGNNGPGTIH